MINVAIVDDHTLFRKALKDYLSNQDEINVSIQASNATDLLVKLKDYPIDILLIDIFMPQLNGIEAIKRVRREYQDIKVIVVSMCTDLVLVNELADIGIHAYISKSDEPENLLQAIISISKNKVYRNKLLTEALYWNRQMHVKHGADKNSVLFDEREKKILQLLWEEKSNKEIANEIFLSVRSVEKIRLDLKERVGVKSTIGLLKYALSNKIIESGQVIINLNMRYSA